MVAAAVVLAALFAALVASRVPVVEAVESVVPKWMLFRLSENSGSTATWADEMLIRRLRNGNLSNQEVHRFVDRMLPFSGKEGLEATRFQNELWVEFVPKVVAGDELLWLRDFKLLSLRRNGKEIKSQMLLCLPVDSVVSLWSVSSTDGEYEITYEVEVWACSVGPRRPNSPCTVIRDTARFVVERNPSADPDGWTLKVRPLPP